MKVSQLLDEFSEAIASEAYDATLSLKYQSQEDIQPTETSKGIAAAKKEVTLALAKYN